MSSKASCAPLLFLKGYVEGEYVDDDTGAT